MKKRFVLFLTGLLSLAMLAGCGSSDMTTAATESLDFSKGTGMNSAGAAYDSFGYDYSESYEESAPAEDYMYDDDIVYEDAVEDMEYQDPVQVTDSTIENRKLITTMHLDMETYDFDKLLAEVEERTTALGGYVENQSVNNMYDSSRYANYTIRIPEYNLEEFTKSVTEDSNVTSRDKYVEDVTLTYVDMQSRKEVLRTEEDRLLEMLEAAQDIETMIMVESRLSEVQADIESMESQLRAYDNLISYSTVHLNINEVKVYTVVEEEEESAWERMAKGFQRNLQGLGNGLMNFAVWFVSSLPYLLFIALIIFGIVMIIRGIVKSAEKKSAAKRAAMAAARANYPMQMGYPNMIPGQPTAMMNAQQPMGNAEDNGEETIENKADGVLAENTEISKQQQESGSDNTKENKNVPEDKNGDNKN